VLEQAQRAAALLIEAQYHVVRSEHQEAARTFERVLEIYPGHQEGQRAAATYLMERSQELFGSGTLGSVERLARRAVETDPDLAAAHEWLGALHERAGRRDEALAEFRRALALNPYLARSQERVRSASPASARD